MRGRQPGSVDDPLRHRSPRPRGLRKLVPLKGDCRLFARSGVVVAEPLTQRLFELAVRLELFDDVCPADELTLHEHLRDRRPTRDRGEVLTDRWIGKDVDGGDRRTRAAQCLQRAIRVAAHHESRRAFHEDRNIRVVDHLLDLVRIAHAAPFVLMRSSWIVPSASGAESASYTRRCCSTSDSPFSDAAVTVTWKWSPPPVRSTTSSSVASGNACSSRWRRGCVLTLRS